MKRTLKSIMAIGLASIMMAGTAYAGTFEEQHYDPIEKLDGLNDQSSLKTYTGFADDRSQATLVDKGWKYKKEDGTYAVSEWAQDEAGKSYYLKKGMYSRVHVLFVSCDQTLCGSVRTFCSRGFILYNPISLKSRTFLNFIDFL